MASTDIAMGDAEQDARKRAMRQVEFYFADTNLPYDKFMWSLYTKDPEEHWIPLNVIASFKRMREYQAKGVPWLVDVLKESGEIEIKQNSDEASPDVMIRRRTQVSEPKSSLERSVYAKGFPVPPCSTPSFPELSEEQLQLKLESYFASFAPVMSVRMRRDEKKKFKGSVFVEFATAQGVDDFLLGSKDEDGKAKRSWEGHDLLIMTKEEYCDMKIKEKGLTGKAANQRREMMVSKKFDAFKLMEKEKAGPSPVPSNGSAAPEKVMMDFLDTKLEVQTDEKGVGVVDAEKVPFVPHASLRWDGSGENVAWADLKTPLKDLFEGRTPFIKNAKGTTYGMVGFHRTLTETDLQKVQKALPILDGETVRWAWLDEEDEKAFQLERAQTAARSTLKNYQDARTKSAKGRGRGGARGGAQGRGRGRGGARGNRFAERKGDNDKQGTEGVPVVVAASEKKDGENEQVGEKRKRTNEDDGSAPTAAPEGMNDGDRDVNASASKKTKVDES